MVKQNDIEEKGAQAVERAAKVAKKETDEKVVAEKTVCETDERTSVADKAAAAAAEKATSKPDVPKVRSKTPQEKEGEEILTQYPDAHVVFVTSNGFGFFRETDARNHAATLQDKTITIVKRK